MVDDEEIHLKSRNLLFALKNVRKRNSPNLKCWKKLKVLKKAQLQLKKSSKIPKKAQIEQKEPKVAEKTPKKAQTK